MKIVFKQKKDVAILHVEGNIDINSSDFIETAGWVLKHRTTNILCDFGGVNLVDYIGISVLAIIYKNILNHNGTLKFYNIPQHINKLFGIVGLSKAIEAYDTEEEALRSFEDDAVIAKIMKQKLRRRFKRIPFNKTIEYKQKFSRARTFVKGKILNISAVGAFIIGEQIFPFGEILRTKLHLLPKPGIVEVDARVIWLSNHDMHPLEYPAMGIEFYQITSKKQKQILEFIEKHLTSTEI